MSPVLGLDDFEVVLAVVFAVVFAVVLAVVVVVVAASVVASVVSASVGASVSGSVVASVASCTSPTTATDTGATRLSVSDFALIMYFPSLSIFIVTLPSLSVTKSVVSPFNVITAPSTASETGLPSGPNEICWRLRRISEPASYL